MGYTLGMRKSKNTMLDLTDKEAVKEWFRPILEALNEYYFSERIVKLPKRPRAKAKAKA